MSSCEQSNSGSASVFREWRDIQSFFRHSRSNPHTVVFYSEGPAYTQFFEGYLEVLRRNVDIDVLYITSDVSDPVLRIDRPHFHAFYIRKLLPFFLPFISNPVLVMTLPELERSYLRRSIHGTHHVYVFHALVSTHMQYREGSFDFYDAVFCVGPHHVREIRRRETQAGLPPKELVEAGYPLLDTVWKEYGERVEGQMQAPRILIAPSWAPGNIMDACIRDIITALSPSYEMIVRPHPQYVKNRPDAWKALRQEYRERGDILFETGLPRKESLFEAGILITDWSGIAFEYAYGTERPVLYIDTPKKAFNPDYEKLGLEPLELRVRREIGVALQPEEIPSRLAAKAGELMADAESWRGRIRKSRDESVFNLGEAAETGAAYLARRCLRPPQAEGQIDS